MVLILLGALAGCAFGAGSPTPHGATATSSAIGATLFPSADRHRLPAVHGRTIEGRALALRDLTGSAVLVVNVWASWCSSCHDESAALARVAASSAPGVTFVGIDEQDTAAAARSFVAATGTGYPQLADPDGTILAQLAVLPSFGIPSTLIVDRHGLMAARYVGAVTGAKLQALINRVRAD